MLPLSAEHRRASDRARRNLILGGAALAIAVVLSVVTLPLDGADHGLAGVDTAPRVPVEIDSVAS